MSVNIIPAIYTIGQTINFNASQFVMDRFFKDSEILYEWLTFKLPVLLQQLNGEKTLHNAINIMDSDWQNLIILDACRYDVFQQNHPFTSGTLKQITSPASNTLEWVQKNLTHPYKDVVLITANGFLSKTYLNKILGFNPFYHVEPVWDYGWDPKFTTVPPQKITRAAHKMHMKYPQKRLLIWYLQPHHPFITNPEIIRPWRQLRKNKLPIPSVLAAYTQNLNLVLDNIQKKLLAGLHGKTIISADHGDCFGELYVFGHPIHLHIPPLITVPFYEFDH